MIGTIEPNSKDLIPGLVWQCRKKPLLLDEFKTGERGDTAAVDAVVDSVLEGAHVFILHQFAPCPYAKIGNKDFQRIRAIAAEVRESPPRNKEFRHVYARSIGDLCRIFAVTRHFDQQLFRLVCYLKAGVELGQTLTLVGE
jgi:hypothetical protein